MSLDTLHIEAGVPHYQEKLQKSMNRFFNKMAPESPVIRNNVRSATLTYVTVDKSCHSTSFSLTTGLIDHTAWEIRTAIKWPRGQPPTA